MLWKRKICVAPTVLGPGVRCFPALAGWGNLWRAYGADEEKRTAWGERIEQGWAAISVRGVFRHVRAFMRWLLVRGE